MSAPRLYHLPGTCTRSIYNDVKCGEGPSLLARNGLSVALKALAAEGKGIA